MPFHSKGEMSPRLPKMQITPVQ